jgi:hypothetical protein
MAVFTTASRYFFFDAYHPAHGRGLVLEKGDGARLMRQLLHWLAEPAAARPAPEPAPAPAAAPTNGLIMPVAPEKDRWLEWVQKHVAPRGYHLHSYIDCGAVADLPYTRARGLGYGGAPESSWLVRWSWSERFHATAANARAFDRLALSYRLDGLAPDRSYTLGVLSWAYQTEARRPFSVAAGNELLAAKIVPPTFADGRGPLWTLLPVPPNAVDRDSLTVTFKMASDGDGTFTSVAELWLFESGRRPAVTAAAVRARFESPSAGSMELPHPVSRYRGLIGARSPAGGGAAVDEMSRAAAASGLSFLVFTDPVTSLTEESFADLRTACAAASTPTFAAVPGYSFSDSYTRDPGDPHIAGAVRAYVFDPVRRLPAPKDFGDPYSLFWKFFGGELAGGRNAAPTLASPTANGISPFHQRFWRGFDLRGPGESAATVASNMGLYADVLAAGYGPFPRVSGDYRSPSEISAAAAGWHTVISAPELGDLGPHHYTSTVSNGPQIQTFALSHDYVRWGGSGGGILADRLCWLQVRVAVSAAAPLTTVTLRNGAHVLRRWRPQNSSFSVQEAVAVAGQGELWLEVQAAGGGRAVSGRYLVQDRVFTIGMCGDNQNTICNLARPPSRYELDEREIYLSHSYWHTGEAAGQLGVMRAADELVPRIIETGIIQPVKHFRPCPVLYAEADSEDHLRAELRIAGGSRDFAAVEYRFAHATARSTSRTLLTAFRPVVNGGTTTLVESRIDGGPGCADVEAVQTLAMALMPTLPEQWQCSYQTVEGDLVTTPFADLGGDAVALHAGGGIMLWPNELGALLILPLDDVLVQARFDRLVGSRGRERIRLFRQPTALASGESLKTRTLVVWHPAQVTSARALHQLRRQYTALPPGFRLKQGTRVDGFPLTLAATEGAVIGRTRRVADANPVPIRVTGLNRNWAVLRRHGEQTDAVAGVEDEIVTVLEPRARGRFAIGHPVAASVAALRLSWGGRHAGGCRLQVHNPTAEPMTFRLRSTGVLSDLELDAAWTLAPGQTTWLWGSGTWLVQESADCQVAAADARERMLRLTIRGEAPVRFSAAAKRIACDSADVVAAGGPTWSVAGGPAQRDLVLRPRTTVTRLPAALRQGPRR